MQHYSINGIDIFNSNQTTLAHSPNQIMWFSCLIGANSIIVGILWICYVLWHASYCNGILFKQLVFFIDTLFDTGYALYPIIVTAYDVGIFSFRIIAGSLQTTTLYAAIIYCIYIIRSYSYLCMC